MNSNNFPTDFDPDDTHGEAHASGVIASFAAFIAAVVIGAFVLACIAIPLFAR